MHLLLIAFGSAAAYFTEMGMEGKSQIVDKLTTNLTSTNTKKNTNDIFMMH